MTKIAFIIGFFVSMMFTSLYAQNASEKLYNNLSDEEGFSSISFSKSMIDILDMTVDGKDGNERKVTGDLNKIKALYYSHNEGDLSPEEFRAKVMKYFKSYRVAETDDMENEGNIEIEMRYLGTKKKVSEFHVILWGEGANAVVSFYGDMDVEEIEGLKDLGIGMSKK